MVKLLFYITKTSLRVKALLIVHYQNHLQRRLHPIFKIGGEEMAKRMEQNGLDNGIGNRTRTNRKRSGFQEEIKHESGAGVERRGKTGGGVARSDVSRKLNINTASKNDMMRIIGLENNTADEIIHYRENQGTLSVDDLEKIPSLKGKDNSHIREHFEV